MPSSWNTTAGKVEVTALAHNDTLLILDETKRAGKTDKERAQAVVEMTFKLSEQTEKERLTSSEPARAWRCYFLSTSNFSLQGLAKSGGIQIDEAELGRLADIPLPLSGHGLFEELHGFSGGEALSDALQAKCRSNFGVAGVEFVRRLSTQRRTDRKTLKGFLRDARWQYKRKLAGSLEKDDPKPLHRQTGRFATVFAAGALAIECGVLPWTRKGLLRAILSCQLDGLRHVEQDPRADAVSQLKETLVSWLRQNHHQMFRLTGGKRPSRAEAVPIIGFREEKKGQRWYYLTEQQLANVVGSGPPVRELKALLKREGMMDHDGDKFVVQRRLYNGGNGNNNFGRVNAFKAQLAPRENGET